MAIVITQDFLQGKQIRTDKGNGVRYNVIVKDNGFIGLQHKGYGLRYTFRVAHAVKSLNSGQWIMEGYVIEDFILATNKVHELW